MAGPWATGTALKAAIVRKAAREDLADQCDEFLGLAVKRLQRLLNLRYVDTKATGTLTADVDTLTLPTDCIDVRALWILSTPPTYVEVVNPAQFLVYREELSGVGIPTVGMVEGLKIKLADTPSDDLPYELHYQAELTVPADDGTNWLLDNGPDVLFYAALCELALEIHDDQGFARWCRALGVDPATDTLLPDGAVAQLRKLEWRARAGFGPLHARPRGPTP